MRQNAEELEYPLRKEIFHGCQRILTHITTTTVNEKFFDPIIMPKFPRSYPRDVLDLRDEIVLSMMASPRYPHGDIKQCKYISNLTRQAVMLGVFSIDSTYKEMSTVLLQFGLSTYKLFIESGLSPTLISFFGHQYSIVEMSNLLSRCRELFPAENKKKSLCNTAWTKIIEKRYSTPDEAYDFYRRVNQAAEDFIHEQNDLDLMVIKRSVVYHVFEGRAQSLESEFEKYRKLKGEASSIFSVDTRTIPYASLGASFVFDHRYRTLKDAVNTLIAILDDKDECIRKYPKISRVINDIVTGTWRKHSSLGIQCEYYDSLLVAAKESCSSLGLGSKYRVFAGLVFRDRYSTVNEAITEFRALCEMIKKQGGEEDQTIVKTLALHVLQGRAHDAETVLKIAQEFRDQIELVHIERKEIKGLILNSLLKGKYRSVKQAVDTLIEIEKEIEESSRFKEELKRLKLTFRDYVFIGVYPSLTAAIDAYCKAEQMVDEACALDPTLQIRRRLLVLKLFRNGLSEVEGESLD